MWKCVWLFQISLSFEFDSKADVWDGIYALEELLEISEMCNVKPPQNCYQVLFFVCLFLGFWGSVAKHVIFQNKDF